ncbi:MAG: hypothetical protein Tsb0013_22830 [Phycisphaerales bacterium]
MNETPEGPDAAQLNDLDAKREAALSGEASHESERDFWGAMLGLEQWHLVCAADEEALEAGNAPALMTLRDGEDRVLAPVYSTSERARSGFTKINEATGAGQAFSVLSLPTRNAVAYLCAISANTPFLLIDNVPGELKAYGNSTHAVPGWYDHHVGPCPIECFNLLSRIAAETSQAAAFLAAYRSACAAQALFVVRTQEGQLAIATEQGKSFLPVFTTRPIAEQQAASMGDVTIEPVSPERLGPTDDELRSSADASYLGVVFDPGISTLVMDPELWKKACDSVA